MMVISCHRTRCARARKSGPPSVGCKGRSRGMYRGLRAFTAAALVVSAFGIVPSFAQKSGGILRVHAIDSPPSLSMHEEIDAVPARATMGVFNNLVMFDQHAKQNSITSVVPDLATGWSSSEDGTELTFALRQGVKWHDGKPFTAAAVTCTWDLLLGKANDKLRVNPRKSWYRNLAEVSTNGDYEVTFRLERPQPAFVMLLASVIRWSIRAMLLRRRCGSIPSAPDPLDLSSLSRTSGSR